MQYLYTQPCAHGLFYKVQGLSEPPRSGPQNDVTWTVRKERRSHLSKQPVTGAVRIPMPHLDLGGQNSTSCLTHLHSLVLLLIASPAVEQWATCPLDFQQFNFFQFTLELHKVWQRVLRLPLRIYLYSASATAVVQSQPHEPSSLYYFVSLYMRQICLRSSLQVCPPRITSGVATAAGNLWETSYAL